MFRTSFADQVGKRKTCNGFYLIIQNENELVNKTRTEVLPEQDKLSTKIQISIHDPTDLQNKVLKINSQQQIVKMDKESTASHCRYVTNSEHEVGLEDNICEMSLRK